MKHGRIVLVTVIMMTLGFTGTAMAQFYHEKAAATSSITYDGRSFIIKGNPVYIYSGDIDYCRVPKELWRDRLTRIKRSGYNAITFYTFWNFMEPVHGQFHFEDNLDVDAWLSLIEEMGMYAIVRPGPYICAEIDFGGWAPWTVDVAGIVYRNSNTQYLQCVDAYFDKVFPLIIKHQIHKGGCVIAVQLENEYYPSSPDAAYKQHLIDKANSLGLEVPYIWSMIYNGGEFDPGTFPTGTSPWFSSELWTGWINSYGDYSDSIRVDRAAWEIVAAGTGGLSHYMIHGGTNFGYSASDDQRITSYDYGAPIGELGQFRTDYFQIKQTGMIARTFGSILSTSTNGSSLIGAPAAGLRAWVHNTTGLGKMAILTNTSSSNVSFKVNWTDKSISVPTTFNWTLAPSKFTYFLSDVPVTSNVNIDYSATNILGLQTMGSDVYLTCYGSSSASGEISLYFKTAAAPAPSSPWTWDGTARKAHLLFTYPGTDSVYEVTCAAGNSQTMHLLIMNTSMSSRTWADTDFIVCGQHYVDENRNIQFPAAGGKAIVYTASGKTVVTKGATTAPVAKSFASGWTWITAAAEAGTSYNDAAWQTSTSPQDMTYYNWPNGYGWYRTTYTASSAGSATLSVGSVQDEYILFVNGQYVGHNSTQMQLVQGANTIALLAVDYSRNKAYGYYAVAPQDIWRSGIFGNVTINGSAATGWRFKGGFTGVDESPLMGTISSTSWSSLLAGQWAASSTAPSDNKPKLWRMDFNYTPPTDAIETWTLTGSVAANCQGVVWVNGHCLGRQITNQPGLFVPQCWLSGTNTILVLTADGTVPQGYSLTPVEYYSFAKIPATGIARPNINGAAAGQGARGAGCFLVSGDHFTVPGEFQRIPVIVAVYDMSGKFVRTIRVCGSGIVQLWKTYGLSSGVYLVKIKRDPSAAANVIGR
jgi:beta-galactosidase